MTTPSVRLGFALAVLLTVLVPASTAGVRAQAALVPLKIATTPLDVGAEAFFALGQGFFRDAGIDAQVQAIDNGAAVASGVASGTIDIGQSNIVSIATAHDKKLPFVIIAPAARYSDATPTTVIVALKTSPLKTAKDLIGKTTTTNGILNIGQIATMAWLEKNGADPKAVKFIELPIAAQPAALESGRIDVALLAEPVLSEELATGKVRLFAKPYSALGSGWLIGAYFTTESWAKAHPDLVRKFAAVMEQTARWANAHQAESAKILEGYTKVHLGPQVARAVYAERLLVRDIQPVIDAAARYGAISAPFPAAELLAQP
jgi:NitT/TauT family transport system substrate-binding protein